MKKLILLLLLMLAVGGYFFFSENGAKSAVENQANIEQQPLIVVTPWEITSLDPGKSGYLFQRLQLAETLVETDSHGKLLPSLAESWQANENADKWVFNLRRDVIFHDGSRFTADNVLHSLQTAMSKPSVLNAKLIKKITALEDFQVEFELEKPLAAFPAYLAHYSALILANSAFDEQGNVVKLIGSGPYRALKIEPPQKIEQEAFADYWGEKAKIKHVSYLANSRSEMRTLLAQSEPNYLVFNLEPASLNRLRQDPNLQLKSNSIARTIQFKLNGTHPLFADMEVRQALSDAIDRRGIAESVLRIENGAADQLFPQAFSDWRLNVTQSAPDYADIKSRLLRLGFQTDEQGMLLKDGKPVKFTLRTFSDRPELPIIATALQNQWRQIGMDVAVSVGNFSEIPAGHQDGSLEMGLYARNYALVPDPIGALLQDFAPQGGDWGVMNWQSENLTQALAQLEKTTDPKQQYPLKQQIAEIIYREKPIIPVVYYQQNAVAHKTLQGLEIDPFERNFGLSKLSWQE
ncbi:ABC transporter substrate-binding protein [Caviibacterium pharyngocola]|uniref:ABC transporter substrate-binding protein n=1 Tax=Caviibacterium pharyngocola TaxID=28159 RepID=A0A2M8RXT3_9PAST|nr:ABC transporter substrate-binding protein [Caviibacterium pharyngocola]PJG83695.1 ABC transporter substrate-binding protein [Caviibacterium pharyngocola]